MKILNNILRIILFILILLPMILQSCDKTFLDEKPRTFLSEGAIFDTKEGAIAATTSIYQPWRSGNLYGRWIIGILEMSSDYLFGRGGQAPLGSYSYDATVRGFIGGIWVGNYQVINRANILIQQIEQKDISGVDANLRNRLIGEAKFNRALAYFHLVRLFGDVPLRTKPETVNLAIARTSEAEVYSQIINDLEFAEANLPGSYPANELGRATRWAASSLLADVYLTIGNYGDAAAKAKEVMDSGHFSLLEVQVPEDFQKIFGPDVVTHPEEIFSIKNARIPGLGTGGGFMASQHRGGSGYHLGANWHAWYGNFNSWLGDWVNELDSPDPDLRALDWLYNGPHDERFLDDFIVMLFKKYRDTESDPAGNDIPILRYTEVVLIYAEAVSQANGGPTTEAYEAVNMVRRRAFGRDMNQPDPDVDLPAGLSAQEFQDEVLLERAKEFVMEGKRWYDLLRTGTALEVIRASGPIKANIQERHLKWPIPSEEIDNNEAMSQADQNPGW